MTRLVQVHTCMSRLVKTVTFTYVKTRSVTYMYVETRSVTYVYVKTRSVSLKLAHGASITVYPEAFARFVAVPRISQPRTAPGCAASHHPTPLLVLAVPAGPFTDYRSAEKLAGREEVTVGSLGA